MPVPDDHYAALIRWTACYTLILVISPPALWPSCHLISCKFAAGLAMVLS